MINIDSNELNGLAPEAMTDDAIFRACEALFPKVSMPNLRFEGVRTVLDEYLDCPFTAADYNCLLDMLSIRWTYSHIR